MAGFAEATTVRDGEADLDPQWTVGSRPHGGYLLAVLARAARSERHPDPLSASALYLSPPDVGPAAVTVEPLREGRTASQVRARLTQKDRTCVEALFTLGHLGADQREQRWVDTPPPPVTDRESLARTPVRPEGSAVSVNMLDLVDQRIDWRAAGEAPGDLRGWLSLPDGQDWDPISLLFAADAFPPATFTLGSNGWTPTLELTAYVRGMPAPGPVRVRQRARVLSDSLVDQVCEIWDSAGRVVVQASQLAAYRMATR
ncbi:thioesterase family protein [Dactylosporangium fulvum]|uniref:Thioesterase family protein n=1 Tax=Dactylosporangium fulvum TaxID=53359 RepID=A0ABY5VTN1_9ACTN|nr:thioesterase family protein [Dactylosporangium fulvum]UWP81112.1 thioesterase family protein [Dactylosporangium fulvum]